MSRERMNSSPEYVGPNQPGFRPRFRRRTMSIENTSLTEVITIYEKLKKSRDHDPTSTSDVFRPSTTHFGFDIEESDFEESVPLEPFNAQGSGPGGMWSTLSSDHPVLGAQKVLDFNKFKNMQNLKYLYFSSPTGLIQSPTIEDLKFSSSNENFETGGSTDMNYVKLLKSKQYWLNITDPSEKDLALLNSAFNVHDLTLRDIRDGFTEEKIEVYKHYMFISLRLLSENDTSSHRTHSKKKPGLNNHHLNNIKTGESPDNNESVFLNVGGDDLGDNVSIGSSSASSSEEKDPMPPIEDVDFNILLFSDFIITVHDKNWGSIKDVLGFLSLLCTYGNSILSPDWVLFSIFIELAQDAKYSVNYMEPKILNAKIAETESENSYVSGIELSRVLRKNFQI
ncbi:uncharacterized protein LOC110859409 isoform X2 [Folsomia candida]|uniref:uncharacterized protein LOC110859409 isoform X2 n=1 Tax=Folsomia candida TaxID=158441 RepID=UPI0016051BE0|nr:uncharacterized protein LOC110859409 isoform X2 [Folsomia candida]